MKILKLCTSDELRDDIPDADRAYRVAEAVITAETGELVETVLKPIWPGAELPSILERWMKQYEPDLVLFVVSPYWTTFESVPLKLQRRFGRAGKAVGDMGIKAGTVPWLVTWPPFQWARRMAVATIGGAYPFEPAAIEEVVERCARIILRDESVGLVIRGPLIGLGRHGTRRTIARAERRRFETHVRLKNLCARLYAGYVGSDTELYTERGPDTVHSNAAAHRRRGQMEGLALAEAWKLLHSSSLAR